MNNCHELRLEKLKPGDWRPEWQKPNLNFKVMLEKAA
jgi:hypothetical protein